MLLGPCASAKREALDPLPTNVSGEAMVKLVRLGQERFLRSLTANTSFRRYLGFLRARAALDRARVCSELSLPEQMVGAAIEARRSAVAAEHSIPRLVGSVLLCQAAGGIGSIFSNEGIRSWYPKLEKPSFTPASWVFGPVWDPALRDDGCISLRRREGTRRGQQRGTDLTCSSRDTAGAKRTVVIRVLQAQISWLGARGDRFSLGCHSSYHRGLLEGL